MLSQIDLLAVLLVFITIAACFLYFFIFQTAIHSALREHQGQKFFSRIPIIAIVAIALVMYYILAQPFRDYAYYQTPYQPSPIVSIFALAGVVYLALEIPYQLVKRAAKSMAEDIQAVGDDRRKLTRLTSAQTLADIVSKKLKITCELQAFSSNEEFIFLTYVLNNRPVATRLKISQADNPESWKKLGDWILQAYQKETA